MRRVGCFVIVFVIPLVARAIDVQVTIKRVDAESARITFGAPDGRDRTAKVAADAKFLDADGKELAGGLKSEQLKEGTRAVLTVVPEGNQPVITALRLGGAGAGVAQAKAKAKAAAPAEPLPKFDTSALVALTDMGLGETYHGKSGGLYPDVTNVRLAAHEKAGLALAQQVQPLDKNGKPAADGKIVLCTIGFSNTSQCSQGFIEAARGDNSVNPQVVIVN